MSLCYTFKSSNIEIFYSQPWQSHWTSLNCEPRESPSVQAYQKKDQKSKLKVKVKRKGIIYPLALRDSRRDLEMLLYITRAKHRIYFVWIIMQQWHVLRRGESLFIVPMDVKNEGMSAIVLSTFCQKIKRHQKKEEKRGSRRCEGLLIVRFFVLDFYIKVETYIANEGVNKQEMQSFFFKL